MFTPGDRLLGTEDIHFGEKILFSKRGGLILEYLDVIKNKTKNHLLKMKKKNGKKNFV